MGVGARASTPTGSAPAVPGQSPASPAKRGRQERDNGCAAPLSPIGERRPEGSVRGNGADVPSSPDAQALLPHGEKGRAGIATAPYPSQRNIVVLLPGVLKVLVAQQPQRPRHAFAG